MKSVCFFASYFQSVDLPYAVKIYLQELNKHFSKVILLTSQKDLSVKATDFLVDNGIDYYIEKNEGFDFGLWYKAFQKTDIELFDQVALVNDSCILFRSLDAFMNWTRANNADLLGMTYSEAIAPHLQSFFLIINKPIIKTVRDFFDTHKIVSDLNAVIRTYEVGLSTFLLSKGFKIAAFMQEIGSQGQFSPYYSHVKEHIRQGIPLIKKKIIFASYRKDELFTLARMNFDVNAKSYIQLIKEQNCNLILSLDELLRSEPNKMSRITRIKFNAMRLLIQLYRKLKYGR